MNHRTLYSLIGLVSILVVGGIVIRLQGMRKPEVKSVPSAPLVNIPRPSATPQIPLVQRPTLTEQEKKAKVSFERVESFKESGKMKYRITLETAYPVSTASMAMRYDSKKIKIESVSAGDGPFLSALPADEHPWGSLISRTMAGGTGLLGKGVFAEVVFGSKSASTAVSLDIAESKMFLNDGWGTKAILELQMTK